MVTFNVRTKNKTVGILICFILALVFVFMTKYVESHRDMEFGFGGLKLSAMYQYIGRTGHETQLDRDNDDLGVAKHSAVVMLQYTF